MADTKTIKYDPSTERDTNLFLEEYYSVTDVNILLNDVKMDNIAGIGYTLQEQLKPLYGYASRLYDDVSIGNRIVVGTIRIPIGNLEETKRFIFGQQLDLTYDEADDFNGSDGDIHTDYPDVDLSDPFKWGTTIPEWVSHINIGMDYPTMDFGNTLPIQESPYPDVNRQSIIVDEPKNEFSTEILMSQYMLRLLEYDVELDGHFNNITAKALIQYQKNNNLSISGILDLDTKNKLFNLSGNEEYIKLRTGNTSCTAKTGPGNQYPIAETILPNTEVLQYGLYKDYVILKINNVLVYVYITEASNWVVV